MEKVKWSWIEVQLRDDFREVKVKEDVANASNHQLKALKVCLSLAFFMNVCKKVPGSASTAVNYLSVDSDGILMKIDKQSILNDCYTPPEWIVFTAASAPTFSDGLGIIKQATVLKR